MSNVAIANTIFLLGSLFVAACGFSASEPQFWPEGHRWLRVDQDRHKVTCVDCLTAAREWGF